MQWLLERDEIVSLKGDPRGVRVRCGEGRLWLTQAGDSRDHVLQAGDQLQIRSEGKIVLWASARSTVEITPCCKDRTLRAPWRTAWASG